MIIVTSLCLLFIALSAAAADPAKARALSIPKPTKLPEASRRHLAGSGRFLLQVDKTSGAVTSVSIVKSTGQPLLDQSAIQAFQKWRFAPGGPVKQANIVLTFTADSDVAQYR